MALPRYVCLRLQCCRSGWSSKLSSADGSCMCQMVTPIQQLTLAVHVVMSLSPCVALLMLFFFVLLQKRFVSRLTGDKKVVLFAGRCAHAPNPLLSLGLLDAFLLLHPLLCSVQQCILVYGIS